MFAIENKIASLDHYNWSRNSLNRRIHTYVGRIKYKTKKK